jgi:hypothetical protein
MWHIPFWVTRQRLMVNGTSLVRNIAKKIVLAGK